MTNLFFGAIDSKDALEANAILSRQEAAVKRKNKNSGNK
jgi:hypothetical protein